MRKLNVKKASFEQLGVLGKPYAREDILNKFIEYAHRYCLLSETKYYPSRDAIIVETLNTIGQLNDINLNLYAHQLYIEPRLRLDFILGDLGSLLRIYYSYFINEILDSINKNKYRHQCYDVLTKDEIEMVLFDFSEFIIKEQKKLKGNVRIKK